ncbi:MAG: hypothetical protein EOO16_15430 [Chitinophagaceae bacterium]|nr:MAG: hypothetical protein EOO16_15430 [Chitinophagaceae bacterium]
MQENNFERDVQKKMGELRFEPSAPVWEAVSRQINQKRRRRRLLLFWLFFGLLTGGAGVLYLRGDQQPALVTARNDQASHRPATTAGNHSEKRSGIPAASGTPATVEQSTAPADLPAPGRQADKSAPVKEPQTDRTTTGPANDRVSIPATNLHPAFDQKTPAAKKKTTSRKYAAPVVAGQAPTAASKARTTQPARPQNLAEALKTATGLARFTQPGSDSIQQTMDGPATGTSAPAALTPVSAEPATIAATSTLADSLADAAPPAPKAAGRRRSSIEWSGSAWAGAGFLSQAPAARRGEERASLTSPIPAVPTYRPGPAAGIEVGAAFALGKKLDLTTTIGYAFYSVDGEVSDTDPGVAGAGMLAPPGPVSWKSSARLSWHYVSAGAGLRWKPFARLPLQLGASLGVAQPVGGDSWVYSYNDRSFIRDPGKNEMQLFWKTGLEFRLWHKGSHALFAGPAYQRNFSRTGPSDKYRLSAPSLQVRFRF